MRTYLALIAAAFQSRAAYRMDFVLRLFRRVLGLFVSVAIWRALLGDAQEATSTMGRVSLREMVTYVVISTGISTFVSLFAADSPLWRIEDRIRSGQIAMDLIRPVGFKAALFCETIGGNLFDVLCELVPLLGVGTLVFGVDPPAWRDVPFFALSLANGLIIYLSLSYVLGLLAFWYLEVWHLERFLAELIWLFSGARIPLWFFPPFLLRLSALLPFRLVYFVPIAIYLGKMSPSESAAAILAQFAWIGILLLVERVLWARGIRKLVVQGG